MRQKTILTTLLLALTLPVTAQETKVPVMLRQQLDVAPTVIQITGPHRVIVMLDTLSYILVQTYRQSGDPAIEALPEGQLQLSGDGRVLTVPRNYPYSNITIHTATREELAINADATANVTLQSAQLDTVSLRSLRLTSSSANLWVQSPLTVDDAVLTSTNRGIISYSKMLRYHTMEENTQNGGAITCFDCEKRVINITNEGRVTTDEVQKENLPVVRMMLNHDLPMFASLSAGATGWSNSPFGGLTGSFGVADHRFRMSVHPTGYAAFQFGVNLLTRSHWSLGIGLGVMQEHFVADNARIDIVGHILTNADLSPYYSRASFLQYHHAGDIVWSSSMRTNYMYIPLRAEWRLHSSYRGLRLSAQLMPGVAIARSKMTLVRQGDYPDWLGVGSADNGRIDVETTSVGRYVSPFRCDLRLDVGLSNVSLFVQTSLTPLFRHQDIWLTVILPSDQYDAIDARVCPMSIGCSINL